MLDLEMLHQETALTQLFRKDMRTWYKMLEVGDTTEW